MVFTSPNFFGEGYPLAQKCTWRFVAPEKKVVHVVFLEIDIGKDNSIAIHSGWDTSGGVWNIDNENPLRPEGYPPRSAESSLHMEFASKLSDSSRRRSKGFRALFKVHDNKGKRDIESYHK